MNPDVLDTLNNADWSDILKSQQPDETWAPSTVYKSPDLIAAVEKMTNTGIGEYKLLGGLSEAEGNYALVNLAAMLAQSMHETIQYDACDENNWDSTSGYTSAKTTEAIPTPEENAPQLAAVANTTQVTLNPLTTPLALHAPTDSPGGRATLTICATALTSRRLLKLLLKHL